MAEPDNKNRFEGLADSALDGGQVDWGDAESRASGRDRGVVRQLRVVSAIARVHRGAESDVSSGAALDLPLRLLSRWGSLELLEHVGRGSFGDVYRAWDTRLDREVALKLLHKRTGTDASSSILSEGRLLARVRHPNVVTIHGADRIGTRVGLWMEFVRGCTLEQLLAERGAFGPSEALLVGVDLCRALSAVHQVGIVHRDIKAQNVVREDGGRIVLMDFGTGIEGALDAGASTLSGTPLYVAPELFKGEASSRQSDIYSLGVLLFHLVSRSYPVLGRMVNEVRAGHREGRRVWLRDLRPDLPERFVQVVEVALASDPSVRYQSAGQMEQALLGALPEIEDRSGARHDAASVSTPAAAFHGSRRRTYAIWMAIAAITAAVAIGSLTAGPAIQRRLARAGGSGEQVLPIAGTGEPRDLTARRVSLPQTRYVGRPSPDGRYLSYVDVGGDLCVQDLRDGQSRCLTNKGQSEEAAESEVAISPDGKWVAYSWRTLDGTVELRLVGEDGTWPRVLFRRADVSHPSPLQWSADGTRILTLLELAGGGSQLVLLSTAGGTIEPLRSFAGARPHPALSPDGAFVAFQERQEDNRAARDIFVLDIENLAAPPRAVIQHPADDVFPMWTSDGRLLFASDRGGSLGLWAIQITGGQPISEPELLVRDVGRLAMPLGLTVDGALYYYLQNGMVDVFTQTIDLSGATSPGTPQPAEATSIGSNIASEWSPDGRHLAYVSIRGLVENDRYARSLVLKDTATGTTRRLELPLSHYIGPRWSPDGRTILVRGGDLDNNEGIFAVDAVTGSTRAVILGSGVHSAVLQWSPDGRAVWYDNSVMHAVVARGLAGGPEHVVLDYRADSIVRLMQWPGFRVSPDGRSVAYTGFTFENNVASTVVRVRTLGGAAVELARATQPERVEFQDWTPDARGVLLIKRNPKERRNMLYYAGLDGALPRPLGVSMEGMRDLSLRRDGNTITYTAGMNSLEVWVLERFLTSGGRRMDR